MAEHEQPPSMTWSTECADVFAAMAKAQAGMGPLTASKKADITTKTGADYGYSYAGLPDTLAACLAAYNSEGLAIVQPVQTFPNGVQVRTIITHSSGQWVMSAPLFLGAKSPGAQDIGSAVTYARRYSLQGMVGLSPADDDGAKAQAARPDKFEPPQRRRTSKTPDLGARCSGPKGGHISAANERHMKDLAVRDGCRMVDVWTAGLKAAEVDLGKYGKPWGNNAQSLTLADGLRLRDVLKSKLGQVDREPGDDGDEDDPAAQEAP